MVGTVYGQGDRSARDPAAHEALQRLRALCEYEVRRVVIRARVARATSVSAVWGDPQPHHVDEFGQPVLEALNIPSTIGLDAMRYLRAWREAATRRRYVIDTWREMVERAHPIFLTIVADELADHALRVLTDPPVVAGFLSGDAHPSLRAFALRRLVPLMP